MEINENDRMNDNYLENNERQELPSKKKRIICGIVVSIVIGIFIIVSLIIYNSKWYNKIDEEKMVEVAQQNIRTKFNNVANIRFHYGAEIEYKDESYNNLYYFMFYRVTVTVTNYYNVKSDYYCVVKIIFYKETMDYNANDVRTQKITN